FSQGTRHLIENLFPTSPTLPSSPPNVLFLRSKQNFSDIISPTSASFLSQDHIIRLYCLVQPTGMLQKYHPNGLGGCDYPHIRQKGAYPSGLSKLPGTLSSSQLLLLLRFNYSSISPPSDLPLLQITKADLDTCKTMNRAAVDAEDKFVFAINNVGSKSSVGRELENGKMELKLKPSSDSSRTIKLDDEIKKLQKNIQLDQAAKGQRQRSFLSN
ncbi:hypothetical protein MJO29_007527, partial [Puccinia striiformis f. sp. tritici]